MFTIIYNFTIMPVQFSTMIEAREFIEEFLLTEFKNYCDMGDYTYCSVENDGDIGYFEICSL